MFDPTIYENIKVVLEGEIYDIDLSGEILVINREDTVDLAKMSRKFNIQFTLVNSEKDDAAEIQLTASTDDLAKEILERDLGIKPGCEISVKFYLHILDIDYCKKIEDKLNNLWDHRPTIVQNLSFLYQENNFPEEFFNEVTLNFGRKIDEDNIADIHGLIEHTLRSLKALSEI